MGAIIFVYLFGVVFFILQIILFFKLWGMTDNVSKLTKRFTKFERMNVVREAHKGNPDIGSILFDAVYNEFEQAWIDGIPSSIARTKEFYKPLYQKVGIAFPEVLESIKTLSDWKETFSRVE